MHKNYLKEERGETNIVSLMILLAVIAGCALIFKPHAAQILNAILEWFA